MDAEARGYPSWVGDEPDDEAALGAEPDPSAPALLGVPEHP